ncbi:hypothetical protein [Methylomonas sp.]|uniref:hypothetical protein n=1 Tax=Methylomonas sp. TaxID=418 RepID=UPI0025FB3B36|nr:hypothetical protein [Methylomonas sp.]
MGLFLVVQPGKIDTSLFPDRSLVVNEKLLMPPGQAAKADLIAEIRNSRLNSQPVTASAPDPFEVPPASEHESLPGQEGAFVLSKKEMLSTTALVDDNRPVTMSSDASSDSSRNIETHMRQHRQAQGTGFGADDALSTRDYQNHSNARVKYFAVPLQGGEAVSDNSGSVPYSNYRFNESNKHLKPSVALTMKKPSMPMNSVLTFGQQHYVYTYFKQIHSKK